MVHYKISMRPDDVAIYTLLRVNPGQCVGKRIVHSSHQFQRTYGSCRRMCCACFEIGFRVLSHLGEVKIGMHILFTSPFCEGAASTLTVVFFNHGLLSLTTRWLWLVWFSCEFWTLRLISDITVFVQLRGVLRSARSLTRASARCPGVATAISVSWDEHTSKWLGDPRAMQHMHGLVRVTESISGRAHAQDRQVRVNGHRDCADRELPAAPHQIIVQTRGRWAHRVHELSHVSGHSTHCWAYRPVYRDTDSLVVKVSKLIHSTWLLGHLE